MQPQLTATEIEQRKQALKQLHLDFFKELQETGLGFHPELRGRISEQTIYLSIVSNETPETIYWCQFAEVTIYIDKETLICKQDAGISTSSAIANGSKDSNYWKIKHACIILDIWEQIQGICQKYCGLYAEFLKNEQQ